MEQRTGKSRRESGPRATGPSVPNELIDHVVRQIAKTTVGIDASLEQVPDLTALFPPPVLSALRAEALKEIQDPNFNKIIDMSSQIPAKKDPPVSPETLKFLKQTGIMGNLPPGDENIPTNEPQQERTYNSRDLWTELGHEGMPTPIFYGALEMAQAKRGLPLSKSFDDETFEVLKKDLENVSMKARILVDRRSNKKKSL